MTNHNLDIKRVEFVRYVIQYYTTSIEHETYFPWTVGSCSSKAKRLVYIIIPLEETYLNFEITLHLHVSYKIYTL